MANIAETDSPKARLREQAFARRDALLADERAAAAEAIAARPFPVTIATGMIVSGFSPMKTEINPLPLMRKAAQLGARLALPAIAGRGKPLIMRAYAFGDELARGLVLGLGRAEVADHRHPRQRELHDLDLHQNESSLRALTSRKRAFAIFRSSASGKGWS